MHCVVLVGTKASSGQVRHLVLILVQVVPAVGMPTCNSDHRL